MPCKWSFYKAHRDFLAVVHWIIWINEKKIKYLDHFFSIWGHNMIYYKPKIFLAVRSSPPFLLSTQSVITSL